jgi:hypothetical protein
MNEELLEIVEIVSFKVIYQSTLELAVRRGFEGQSFSQRIVEASTRLGFDINSILEGLTADIPCVPIDLSIPLFGWSTMLNESQDDPIIERPHNLVIEDLSYWRLVTLEGHVGDISHKVTIISYESLCETFQREWLTFEDIFDSIGSTLPDFEPFSA